tara:strand:+ start:64 stop:618 length:555 start_codon:yes stop_codon:yes gene_type:complete
MTLDAKSTAIISDCGRYRYRLTRQVGPEPRACTFIMLNPSTADATEDDPTIRRCMAFARAWGCGKLIVVNLFAIRATDPKDMMAADDPVGPDNMEHVKGAADYAIYANVMEPDERGFVVCAWGNHGTYMDQADAVLGWLEDARVEPLCLKVNAKSGQPAHPLYLRADLKPRPLLSVSEEGKADE